VNWITPGGTVGVVLALLMAAAALAPCAPETPAALQLTGIPSVAIPGHGYLASLTGDGSVVDSAGSDFGVTDASGRGYTAHYEYARGVTQAFSVGLRGPYTVKASWTEPVGTSGQCSRTVTVPLPIDRQILAVVNCRRGAEAPASGLVLRCDGSKLRFSGLKWSGWNGNTASGHGTLNGRPATVKLSSPRECSQLDGYIYTRATVTTRSRTLKRVAIDCPLPPRS
jgi:hypothetical protein